MRRLATALTVMALCLALGSSLGMSASAAPSGTAASPAAAAAKKKKCRKGYVRKRVTLKTGKKKGKRAYRCVQKRKKPPVRQLSPV
jgi:hypothetical protein